MISIRTAFSFALTVVTAAGCALHHSPRPPSDACWLANPPTDYIVRDAANFLIARKGTDADRARTLAAAPLIIDSVRAHSRLIDNQATCARLWLALDPQDRGAQVAVIQIGRTYWVRSAGGMRAFDDSYHLLAAFADL